VPLKTELRQPPLLLENENGRKSPKKGLRNPQLPSEHNQVSEKEEADPKTSKRNKNQGSKETQEKQAVSFCTYILSKKPVSSRW
jgi:hypothetical protein